jgi:hygromycin-B 7''-O-kinase
MTILLPAALTPEGFDAFHDDPAAWRPAMGALVRAQGWTGDWRPAGEGTVLVALLGSEQVLKLYPPFLRDHWAFERGMLARLQGRLSVPTPALLASGEHQGWTWTRMSLLPGRLLEPHWQDLDEAQKQALLRRLGELVNEVHALPVGEQTGLALPWPVFLAQRRAGALTRHQRVGLPAHLLAALPAFLEGPVPEGPDRLLTGEYTPMNLLVDEQAALCGMFDFGDGLIGPRAYDWLGPLTFLAAGRAARVGAFFAGLGEPLPDPLPLMRLFLLHRYSHLRFQLRDVPGWQDSQSLEALAARLFSAG